MGKNVVRRSSTLLPGGLNADPWNKLDGPSLACAAAALQLMPENINYLIRLQRLAAIGASLPARQSAPRLSPSRLRSLLKHPLVSGRMVQDAEDPYEDIYVLEVPFHGGPRRVIQGLTSQAVSTLNLLLPAILQGREEGLPREYRRQVAMLAEALLTVSELVCQAGNLPRGTAPGRRDGLMVPGQARLDELCAAVTFTDARFAAVYELGFDVLERLCFEAGALGWTPERLECDQLAITSLMRTDSGLVVVSPGELAAALRHHIITTAIEYDCLADVATVVREHVHAEAARLLRLCGAEPSTQAMRHETAPLTRQRYAIADDKIIDMIVLADDLDGYRADEPFGTWRPSGLAETVDAWFSHTEGDSSDPANTLRLVINAGVGRYLHLGFPTPIDGSRLLVVRPDELEIMAELDGTDPLFLWYFANAEHALHESSRVLAFSTLDLYALYREHEQSFYLDDEHTTNVMVSVASDSALPLRKEAIARFDVHQAPGPRRPVYVDVVAEYGRDVAPIYISLGPDEPGGLLVEFDGMHAWVLRTKTGDDALDELLETVAKAAAYWLWQIERRLPGLLAARGTEGRLIIEVSLDDREAWSHFANCGQRNGDAKSWLEVATPSPGRFEIRMLAAGARLLVAEHNEPDRALLAALIDHLVGAAEWPDSHTSEFVEELAPLGPKRMMRFASSARDQSLRPTSVRVRRIQLARTATIMDELGAWLTAGGLAQGEIPDDKRTEVLNKAVGHYFDLLVEAVAELSPEGLLEQLIARDEALIHDMAFTNETVVSRIACFGGTGAKTQDLLEARQRALATAIASRFLIEYVAAQPPAGIRPLTLERYDYLLALADELTSRGLLSDAVRHGFSDAKLSMLPSGRLGVSRGGRYEAGTDAFRAERVEDLRKLALEPALNTADRGTGAPDAAVEKAMRAEFGFTFEQMGLGVGELIALADEQGSTGPYRAGRGEVRDRLSGALGWSEQTVDAFLDAFTLKPRAKFLSVGADAYPWRFNRAYSYPRRPLIARVEADGEQTLLWGVRRLWDSGSYMVNLVYGGRLQASSSEMRRVCVTVRQGQNKDFERRFAQAMKSGGCTLTAHSIARINGHKLTSADGDDLGDIDALGLDTRRKVIFVGEAKDFEIARTPTEMAHEADALIRGDKSAVFKTTRRAQWIREHLADVLAHFHVAGPTRGWRVQALISTSRDLLSPRVVSASVPVIAVGGVEEWIAAWPRHGSRSGRNSR